MRFLSFALLIATSILLSSSNSIAEPIGIGEGDCHFYAKAYLNGQLVLCRVDTGMSCEEWESQSIYWDGYSSAELVAIFGGYCADVGSPAFPPAFPPPPAPPQEPIQLVTVFPVAPLASIPLATAFHPLLPGYSSSQK